MESVGSNTYGCLFVLSGSETSHDRFELGDVCVSLG